MERDEMRGLARDAKVQVQSVERALSYGVEEAHLREFFDVRWAARTTAETSYGTYTYEPSVKMMANIYQLSEHEMQPLHAITHEYNRRAAYEINPELPPETEAIISDLRDLMESSPQVKGLFPSDMVDLVDNGPPPSLVPYMNNEEFRYHFDDLFQHTAMDHFDEQFESVAAERAAENLTDIDTEKQKLYKEVGFTATPYRSEKARERASEGLRRVIFGEESGQNLALSRLAKEIEYNPERVRSYKDAHRLTPSELFVSYQILESIQGEVERMPAEEAGAFIRIWAGVMSRSRAPSSYLQRQVATSVRLASRAGLADWKDVYDEVSNMLRLMYPALRQPTERPEDIFLDAALRTFGPKSLKLLVADELNKEPRLQHKNALPSLIGRLGFNWFQLNTDTRQSLTVLLQAEQRARHPDLYTTES